MQSEEQRIPSVFQVARALRGPFIGDKFEQPDLAKAAEITDALPVLTLESLGGPSVPSEQTDRDNPELRARLENVRRRLAALAPRFKDVSSTELRKWLHEHNKGGIIWEDEGRLLYEAALLVFQLEPEGAWKKKGELRKAANALWGKDGRTSPWFKRNREEFICEQFATWLIEDEKRHVASAAPSSTEPNPEPNAQPQQSGAASEREPPPSQVVTAASSAPPKPVHTKAHSGWLTMYVVRLLATRPPSKKSAAIAGALAALIAVAAVLVSVGKESVISSTSSVAGLECPDGKTTDYGFSPTKFPGNPELVDPATLTVNIGSIRFRFEKLIHRERQFAVDSWDSIFKSRDAPGLIFILRSDSASGGGFGYVINGPPGDGMEPDNKVCNLIDFHTSALGEFLKARSNNEGIAWGHANNSR
jgi:hypothetical protein